MAFQITSLDYRNLRIDFALEPKDQQDNYCTILTGKNGVGKSRMLASICEYYLGTGLPREAFRGHTGNNDTQIPLFEDANEGDVESNSQLDLSIRPVVNTRSQHKPERLLTATSSPFDKFPLDKSKRWRREDKGDEGFYYYLGTRNSAGFSNKNSHITRIIETLISSSISSRDRRVNLREIFDIIGLAPEVTVRYRLRISQKKLIELMLDGEDAVFEYINRGATVPLFNVNSGRIGVVFEDLKKMLNNQDYIEKNTIALRFYLDERRFKNEYGELYFSLQRLVSSRIISLDTYELRNKETGDHFDLSSASSGQQSLLLLFLGIGSAIDNDSLILIDEPEISLHPEWQERFLPLLAKVFDGLEGCHFVIATHSPLIVSQASVMPFTIVSLDMATSFKASDHAKRSSDFQLVEVFDTPGYKNEYLARICLTALQMIKINNVESKEFYDIIKTLKKANDSLDKNDPLKDMIQLIIKSQEVLN